MSRGTGGPCGLLRRWHLGCPPCLYRAPVERKDRLVCHPAVTGNQRMLPEAISHLAFPRLFIVIAKARAFQHTIASPRPQSPVVVHHGG